MKYIEKLLNGAEVKWMPLGEVAELKRGRVISKEYLYENVGDYPVYSSQTVNNGEIGKINTFDFEQKAITWTTDGANAGTIFYRDGRFSITNICGLITIKDTQILSYKYLYYWLSIEAKKHVYSGMGNPKLMSNQMGKVPIPIPPLAVQEEIVRILDKFTTLEAELEVELEAELDCRKRQYEYYRNQLLSLDMLKREEQKLNNIAVMALGEMCSVQRGKRLTKRDLNHNGRYPVFHGGIEPIGYYSSSNREANSVMVINVGASAGTVGYSSKEFWSSDGCFCFSHCEQLNQKYLFYALQSMENSIKGKVRKAGIPTLDNKEVEKLKIPIPPLAEQQRIVSILDKFEALTTSISEGLPKEIELRRKQYEYYRNQLLSFA